MSSASKSFDSTFHSPNLDLVAESAVTQQDLADQLTETIKSIVSQLRRHTRSDDQLQQLLLGAPGTDRLKSDQLQSGQGPEAVTQNEIIRPILDQLGHTYGFEGGDLSPGPNQKADYVVPFDSADSVDSKQLLIEAEPLNKNLDQKDHGIGQVKGWLGQRKFQADYGIATDGMRWVLIKYNPDTYGYDILAKVSLQPAFLAAFEDITDRQFTLDEWTDSSAERIDDLLKWFEWDNFVSNIGTSHAAVKEQKQNITDQFYDVYVDRVFGTPPSKEGSEPSHPALVSGISPPDDATGDDVRLFAVRLMNRLIFIRFLEDRELVPKGLLGDMADTHDPEIYPQSFYKTYLEPLFFAVLNERPSNRSQQVRSVRFFSDIPYLNGGLFRPTIDESSEFSDRAFDVPDTVLKRTIRLLEFYTFSTGGNVGDLDPSILGNVFEKTINYLTGEPDDPKKQLGAYYTPDEITRFCAEGTVQPWLLDQFKDTMVRCLGRERVDMDRYDDLFEFIEGTVPSDAIVVETLLESIDELRALDPACGSGHFLTSVLGEIVTVREALHKKHPRPDNEGPESWELYKRTVTENIYGVDLVQPAVEITKLRLWLSIIAEVDASDIDEYEEDDLALPNVVFNVQQGNSLIGYTDLMETTGDDVQTRADAWGADTVREKYEDVIEQMRLYKEVEDTETAREHLLEAERLREGYRTDLNSRVLNEFRDAGIEDVTLDRVAAQQPFHWVLEFAPVYADGGFDVIVGNPPWDQLRPSREEYFSRYDPTFRTRLPSNKNAKQDELLQDEEIASEWKEYQRAIANRIQYFSYSREYQLQKPTIDGRTDPNEKNLAALFLERVFTLARGEGYAAQVLPGIMFSGSYTKDLRRKLLNETDMTSLVGFENKGIFEGIHRQYKFAVATFRNSGRTETLRATFQQRDVEVLRNIDDKSVKIPRRVLAEYSPEARTFPFVTNQREVDILKKLLAPPSLGSDIRGKWKAIPHRELDRSRASDRFIEPESEPDYPVYGGKNISQFLYDDELSTEISPQPPDLWSIDEDTDPDKSGKHRLRERTFNSGELKRAIYAQFGGAETNKSQKQFVNDLLEQRRGTPLGLDDVLLDCTEYRLAFRKIANAMNERTMTAVVLPKGIITHDTIQTIRPYKIELNEELLATDPLHDAYTRVFTDKELFAALGLLNSLPFDTLMRTKLDNTISQYKFRESQMPRLTHGDDWFDYISTRAAHLNCYGEAFAEMRERLGGLVPVTKSNERKRLRGEIDAAAFHAYGLSREETAFILEDFHRVQNPHLMTEKYFDSVLAIYDDLAERTPLS